MALYLTDPIPVKPETSAGPGGRSGPTSAEVLKLTVSAAEQTGDGAALLQISSDALGTRWLLPVSAEKGSLAGLWVGDVVVNDVSEGRLGTTDVAGGLLTVALRPAGGFRDHRRRRAAGEDRRQHSSVAVTLTLALPASEIVAPTVRTGTGLYLRGYVFADTNQNGERDGDEAGFEGRIVTLTLPGGARGRPRRKAMAGTCSKGVNSRRLTRWRWTRAPTGLHRAFMVTPPVTETGQPRSGAGRPNAWPESVTLDEDGVTQVVYQTYTGGTSRTTISPTTTRRITGWSQP